MRRLMLALALLASTEASAHCYSRWYYPWPQRCGVARQMVRWPVLHSVAASSIPNQERSKNKAAIALPGLAQADLDGGGADEPTRARLLLRAALEAANGH
jgi:hypothetical protein